MRAARWPGVFVLAAVVFAAWAGPVSALELGSFFPLSDFLPVSELRNDSPPPWKQLWDEARGLARGERLADAAARYAAAAGMAGRRRQLEWERACVLAGLKKWQDAAAILEPLVEQNPAEVDYLTLLGLVMFERGRFSRALALFEQAAGLSSGDLRALAGRALSLIALNRKKEALPFLQRLERRASRRREVKMALASLAFELKRYSLARRYIVPLARDRKAPAGVLRLAARVHERLRHNRTASVYWRRILSLEPGDREAHGRLALYYENSGRYGKALFHLKKLLDSDAKNASLLKRICRLLVQQDRFAEALPYFERYVLLRPDDREALRSIINLNVALGADAVDFYRRILSIRADDPALVESLTSDLLAAGDSEGALFVHEHLVRISKGEKKAAAIRRMIPLLESLGRQDRLVRALEELFELDPDDSSVALRLASIYLDTGNPDGAAAIIGRLAASPVAASADFLCLRGRLEQARGHGYAAMKDYMACLDLRPWEDGVRRQGMDIAARMGLTGVLRDLAAGLPGQGGEDDLVFLARVLTEAGRYREALAIYDELLGEAGEEGGGVRTDILIDQAGVLFRAGLDFEAEAQLFQVIGEGRGARRAAGMLFSRYLERDLNLAAALLEYMNRLAPDGDPALVLDQARLLAARGEFDRARKLCLDVMALDPSGRDMAGVRLEADLLAADILVRQGMLAEAERVCLTLLGREDDYRVVALLYRIYRLAGKRRAAGRLLASHLEKNGDPAAVAALATAFADSGMPVEAAELAGKVLAVVPESVAMTMLEARSLEESGDLRGALAALKRSPVFSGEESLQVMAAFLYAAMNDYRAAAAQATMVLLSWPERRDMQMLNLMGRAARSGRGTALEAMADVFDPDLDRKVGRALEQAGIHIDVPAPRRSIWDIITFNRGRELSEVERAMDPAMIVTSILSGGRLAAVVAPWYADYHWRGRIMDGIARFR